MANNTANNIINAAISRLKESKMQKGPTAQSQHGDTFGPKSLALKQSTSQSSLGASTAQRRDMMSSPDHFSHQSSNNAAAAGGGVFGASRGSTGNIGRVPFGQTTSSLGFNVSAMANQTAANINRSGASVMGTQPKEGKLILGLARGNSRGASNGRDRYRNTSNNENFEATSQDNSQM